MCGVNHIANRRTVRSAPAIVDNVGSVIDGIKHSVDGVRNVSASIVVKCFDRHNLTLESKTNNTVGVIADSCNNSRDMSSVPVNVRWRIVTVSKIPSMHIINESVVIVVD